METKFGQGSSTGPSRKYSNSEEISIDLDEEKELERLQEVKLTMVVRSSGENGVKGDEIIGEVDELVNLINAKLERIDPSPSYECCIYRVPQKIRQLNEKAYDPRVTSIGPFHYGDKRFKSMEAFKMRHFKRLLQRSTGVGLEKYIRLLKSCEVKARQCYSETFEMSSDEFVTILLIDGCFIIELLLCCYYKKFRDVEHSTLMKKRTLLEDIRHDLILLENQIPFFVLEKLSNLAMTCYEPIPLLDLTISFFVYYNDQGKSSDEIDSIEHFTDLILVFHRPMPLITCKEYHITKTATELDEAGVKFRMSSSNCLFDIKFSKGVLEIPQIILEDDTESTMRNLMALEHCHYLQDSYMIDYFVFLDDLVNTPKDVDLLVQSGIIYNLLGDSKQAASLFVNMNVNITMTHSNFYFSSLCEDLNAYYMIPKHKWRAALKRDYFSSPWRSASTFAAIVLLLLTLIQAICSLLTAAQGNQSY